MDFNFELNCFILGDDPSHIFPVQIIRTGTVMELRELIKEKMKDACDNFDASYLELWKVNLPVDDTLEHNLHGLELHSKKRLSPVGQIYDIFNNPRQHNQLHIVVQLPYRSNFMTVNLNCLILGNDASHTFPVQIALTETVYQVKELIKEKMKDLFDGYGAPSIQLWKADIDPEKENLELPHGDKVLFPIQQLSKVFTTTPKNGHLHIFASAEICLDCLVLRNNQKRKIRVKIGWWKVVDDLKNVIKQQIESALDGVDARHLKLWKVDIDPEKEKLDLPHDSEELMPLTRLFKVFTALPKSGHFHIIVQCPLYPSPSRLLYRTQQLRSEYGRNFQLEHPSSQGKPSEFENVQENPDLAVRWDRPPSAADTIPSTLLHPIFGTFMDDCDNLEPTPDDNKLALALSVAMSRFFMNEMEREYLFHTVLQEHEIDLSAMRIHGTTYSHVIAQVTNEIGSTEAEPHIQALSTYIRATNPFAKDNPAFRFPCIVIALFGPHIDFSAAVWSTRPNMQVISTALPFFYHHTDTKMCAMVARHIGALRKALRSLSECYQSMSSNTTSSSPDPQLKFLDSEFPDPRFPYPYSYTCIETSSTCHFTYCDQMDTTKYLFSAKTADDKVLCVKFARHYSKEVHQRCASGGFAPALYGFEHLPGGWFMIVMEMITEDYCCLANLSARYPHGDAIAKALRSLHEEGYVHGDIRNINIMVKRDCSPGFKLMDFDWSGIIGEVRYPMNVSRGIFLWRPDGAKDGQLILAEHDIQMLEVMFPGRTFI
ncbi:hypothetical protein BDR04DRAFT_1052092 [Suillus decipiens]|nr:hypothetical protein BDR04DRAFT_1052092 [Suillus decipiens]